MHTGSVLEVLVVRPECRSRPMVVDLVSPKICFLHAYSMCSLVPRPSEIGPGYPYGTHPGVGDGVGVSVCVCVCVDDDCRP